MQSNEPNHLRKQERSMMDQTNDYKLVVYTVSERRFLRLVAGGMWVGTEFRDHGIVMRVADIGKVYRQGHERVIDVRAAVEKRSDSKYVHGTFSWLMVEGKALPFPARAQVLIVRRCHRNPVRSCQNKVWFHVFEENTHTYSGCFYAWASANLAFALHKPHHYKVRFNSNQRYPQILEVVEEVFREELRGLEE